MFFINNRLGIITGMRTLPAMYICAIRVCGIYRFSILCLKRIENVCNFGPQFLIIRQLLFHLYQRRFIGLTLVGLFTFGKYLGDSRINLFKTLRTSILIPTVIDGSAGSDLAAIYK